MSASSSPTVLIQPIRGAENALELTAQVHGEHQELVKGLTADERLALHQYAMGSHEYINAHLRGEEVEEEYLSRALQRIALMDGIFERTESKERLTYKYIEARRLSSASEDRDVVLSELASASTFHNREFMSTSSSVDYPLFILHSERHKHPNYILLEVHSRKGISLQQEETPFPGDIQSLETEILLPRNTNFRVTSVNPQRKVLMGDFQDTLLRHGGRIGGFGWEYAPITKEFRSRKYFRVPVVTLQQI